MFTVPAGEIVAAGLGFTLMAIALEVAVPQPFVTVTAYVPVFVALKVALVAPL